MAKNEQQRQKKLAKKGAKQRQRKQALAAEKQQLASLAGKMTAASSGTVEGCYLSVSPAGTEINGMVTVFLARRGPQQQVAMANFLVDFWCLGIKDCFGRLATPTECREMLEDLGDRLDLESIEPSIGRAIVEAGVAYAASLGLAPHPDYRKVALLWGDIPVGELPVGMETGRHGQPCYIVGPHDDIAKQKRIYQTLREHVGVGGFDIVTAADQFGDDVSLPSLAAIEASDQWQEISASETRRLMP